MIFKKGLILGVLFTSILLVTLGGALFAQNDNRVPFRHRVGNPAPEGNLFRIRGDFTIIGNTNLTLADYHESGDNSLNEMIFVDVDKDSTTFNSSSATLMFSQENGADPSCTEILYAGLYWSGRAEMGAGMTFDRTDESIPGIPQEINGEMQKVLAFEKVNYTSYFLDVYGDYDSDDLLYPVFILGSKTGDEDIIFRFMNRGDDKVQYSIGDQEWQSVGNLKIATSDGVTTATFDPIIFSDGEISFTIDNLSRSAGTDSEDYRQEDNSLQIIASGIYTPPHTVTFDKRKVKLKGPGATAYTEITASGNSILFPHEDLKEMYVGYADVTDYVRNSGTGTYTVADLALAEGMGDNTGFYGHWGLIVVYQNSKMHWRDVTIFDGYSFVQSLDGEEHTGEFGIDGFGAVKQGRVDLKLGVMAGEGDRSIEGDFLEIINQNGEWTRLYHPLNSTTNFFNSSIYTPVRNEEGGLVENPRNPYLLNNTGIDIVLWDIPNPDNSIIANEQTSTRFRFGTKQDIYSIYAFAFSVRSYLPVIQAINQIESINSEAPGEDPSVKPGQEITYNLEIRNLGEEATEQTRVVIPVPHTTTFVSAITIPSGYGDLTFDPDMGLAGSIIWDMGEVPLMADPNELIATLQYTLKITEDCFVLANNNCETTVATHGNVSGVGSISESMFSNIPFIQGALEGTCSGEEIPGSLEIPITGRAEFAETHCSGYEHFSGLGNIELPDFCQRDAPVDLLSIIPPSREGYTVYFFTQETGGSPLFNYQVNTAVPGTEQVWVSEGPTGSCTGFRVPLLINVLPRPPAPFVSDYMTCNSSGYVSYTASPLTEYRLLYYQDNDPTSEPLDAVPQVDISIPGEFSVWVSQYRDGECESLRKEVKIVVEDCSLRPAIQVVMTPDVDNFRDEDEVITYTIVVENIGGVPLVEVSVFEYLTNGDWTIPMLEPSGKKTFTTTYVVNNYDLQYRVISNSVHAEGFDSGGVFVNDFDTSEIIAFPPGFLDYEISVYPANCLADGDALGIIDISFQNGSQSGGYDLVREEDGHVFTEYFEDKTSVRIEVPPGEYKLTIFDVRVIGHAVPGIYKVEKSENADFTVPMEITACMLYRLAPETEYALAFRLKGPDGSNIPPDENSFFDLIETGTYTITGIDPLGIRCPVEKTFQATINHPSELDLETMPFCSEDVFTTIHLLHDTDGFLVKWYRVESQGELHLSEFDDSPVFLVQEDGEYEVTLTNEEGCISGKGRIQVAQSFTEPPHLNNLYTICPAKNVNVSIEPGSDFIACSWYLDGVEVSNSLVFVPVGAGLFSLVAKDRQGCEFFVDFEVEYKCDPSIRYPNAIRPNVPDKAFIVYPDNLTEELEVFIQNRWGELIYYCEDKSPSFGKPSTCIWDGTVNNRAVINGAYLVIIRYKIKGEDLIITEKGLITVVD
ncbi:DUF7507 domain-containing protein [Negadavirga shengliensis]|uniref:DUF7507 domain-containing protein n=1 Tax=Negadavirga shengliensis TaxID=1389218 RepID=A0ABV9T792_9BACT